MDKNTIIALILIGLVLLLWPVYMRKVVGVKEHKVERPSESEELESDVLRETEEPSISPFADRSIEEPIDAASRGKIYPITQDARVDTLETNIFRGILSSIGGGTIINWQLKKYLGSEGDSKGESNWVNLIPDSAEGNLGISLGFGRDRGIDISQTIFDVVLDTSWVENGDRFRMLRYAMNFDGGGRVEKEFIVAKNRYDIDMRVRFLSLTRSDVGEGYTVKWRYGLSPTEKNVKDDNNYYQAYGLQGGELLKTKKGSTGLREGSTNWIAVRTKYFLMALVPREPQGLAAELEGEKIQIKDGEGNVNDWKKFTAQLVMPFKGYPEETAQFTLYLGPMDYNQLKRQGVQLEKMMNFGMSIIRPFSIAFLYTLQFFYGIIHNYGWAIIIFSILIKVVLYPLTRKSYQSMRQMQELQPKVMALKEKYKKDPQRLNQETMKLYKQHGVNPMGGCLPLLLQMPILFALFNLFRTTIMLRQAGFLGLISDLSAPDRIIHSGDTSVNILPILMGGTMIVQQKLATQDPKQKAMAYFMPIFLMFIFYRLSAGLNLYYLMFNVLTIAQEMIVKKHR